MLTTEYDYETDIEVQREEAFDEGRTEGKLIRNLYEAKFTVEEIAIVQKMDEEGAEKILTEKES